MIRHLLRLSWHRKRFWLLVTAEIFGAFLVLFSVVTLGLWLYGNWSRPLGFEWERVWEIGFDDGHSEGGLGQADAATEEAVRNERSTRLGLILRRLRETEGVEAASLASVGPWAFSSDVWGITHEGREIMTQVCFVTRGFDTVFGLRPAAGRWLDPADAGGTEQAVVINKRFARQVFGEADPVGQLIREPEDERAWRVAGLVEDFRKDGEFSAEDNIAFLSMAEPEAAAPANVPGASVPAAASRARVIHVRVRDGAASGALEGALQDAMRAMAPGWSFEIHPLSEQRGTYVRLLKTPIYSLGIVAAFLMLMVALGLTGVVWQSVTRRTREIGLRRAMGATPGRLCGEILGEVLVTASFGMALAGALVAQVPLLGLIESVRPGTVASGFFVSAALMYGMTALAALYPGWMASRMDPARALHTE